MNKKNILILTVAIILVIAAIFFLVWSLNYNKKEKEEEQIITDEISKTKDLEEANYTDFVFYKEDKTEVKFADYKNKPAMILFWNPNNKDSVEDLKKVDSMYEKYKDKINFFMINTAEEVDEEIKNQVSIEIFYDFYKEGQLKYKVTELPTLIYITEDNEVFNAKVGFTTTDALEANLDILSNNM